ncbi:Uu.00g079630.m01.CDS01 [Anthostomella pinea]|uniref:Uu.00g079630.m01.CDS01 n=1 Tax=Anthostomella pinea TaxID=933095 RepID=A0AAI8VLI1_9PEZI|nr:Uu.00g079630.m01.CDS01 [Anthostomella pinea]
MVNMMCGDTRFASAATMKRGSQAVRQNPKLFTELDDHKHDLISRNDVETWWYHVSEADNREAEALARSVIPKAYVNED